MSKIISFELHDSAIFHNGWTSFNDCRDLEKKKDQKIPNETLRRFSTFNFLPSTLSFSQDEAKNFGKFKLETREYRCNFSWIHEACGGRGGREARRANKGSCLHSKRGFQLQAPGPWHNLRGQERRRGEKARHRLLSCSHDDSASWILKKKPLFEL